MQRTRRNIRPAFCRVRADALSPPRQGPAQRTGPAHDAATEPSRCVCISERMKARRQGLNSISGQWRCASPRDSERDETRPARGTRPGLRRGTRHGRPAREALYLQIRSPLAPPSHLPPPSPSPSLHPLLFPPLPHPISDRSGGVGGKFACVCVCVCV